MREEWAEVELGDAFDFIGGGTPSKKESSYWNGEIPWTSVKDVKGAVLKKTSDFISEEGLKKSAANVARKGELIVATRIIPGRPILTEIDTAINQDLKIARPKIPLHIPFMYYSFLDNERRILKESSGTTVLGIRLEALRGIPLSLPPLPEQRAIVSKIEQLFSELDNGIANLKAAQQQLKVYRQAVLKQAFDGRLSSTSYTVAEVCEKVQIGPFGSQLHKEDYIQDGIPLINPMHIQDGKICANFSFSISEEKKQSLPNYILKVGDVIMGRRGEMGRCGLVHEKEDGWFCGTGSLYFRPKPTKVNSVFLYYYLSSAVVKELLTDQATGTTMTNLNKKIVSNIPIQLPSVEQQHQIVQEIESRLSVCDKLEESISQSLQKAEALRQSILKKAFGGRLLTEAELAACKKEKDWEPAGVLLGRVKGEKAKKK